MRKVAQAGQSRAKPTENADKSQMLCSAIAQMSEPVTHAPQRVLVYLERDPEPDAALHLTLEKARLIRLAGVDLDSEGLDIDGDLGVLKQQFSILSRGDSAFEIVLP